MGGGEDRANRGEHDLKIEEVIKVRMQWEVVRIELTEEHTVNRGAHNLKIEEVMEVRMQWEVVRIELTENNTI